MAGYAKVWTTIWNDDWFKSLTCLQRGIWLQLISYAKLMGDTGAINLRNFAEFSRIFGLDDSTGAKNLRNFAEVKKIELNVDHNSLSIFILNYEEYQRVMKPEDVRVKAKIPRKIREKSPYTEPDRTRTEQKEEGHHQIIMEDNMTSEIMEIRSDDPDRVKKLAAEWNFRLENQFLDGYRNSGLNLAVEAVKMITWVRANKRKGEKKDYWLFIGNWLNKALSEAEKEKSKPKSRKAERRDEAREKFLKK